MNDAEIAEIQAHQHRQSTVGLPDGPCAKCGRDAIELLADLIETRAALREMISIIESEEIKGVCLIAQLHGCPFPADVAASNGEKIKRARRVLGEA